MTHFALTYFHAGFAYHWHTNRRLLEGIARLDDASYRLDRGYSRGSIHHTLLAHALTEQGHSPGDLDFIFFEIPSPPP